MCGGLLLQTVKLDIVLGVGLVAHRFVTKLDITACQPLFKPNGQFILNAGVVVHHRFPMGLPV
jgi:hypothetical protein